MPEHASAPDRPSLADLPLFASTAAPAPAPAPAPAEALHEVTESSSAALPDPITWTTDPRALAGPSRATGSKPTGPKLPDPVASAPEPEPAPESRIDGTEESMDWALVRAFRSQAAERLSGALQDRGVTDEASQRELGRSIVTELLRDRIDEQMVAGGSTITVAQQERLATTIFDSLFGLGRLQPLVDDPQVENIEINGYDNVVLQYSDGRLGYGPPVADSDEELVDFLQFLASRSQSNERPFSPASPELHLRLDGGSRLAANAWITPRPAVVIRLHRLRKVTLGDLVARGMFDEEMASLLRAAVKARLSIVVSGPQGAGKTTLLRALCAELDPWERLGTLETEYELHLHELPEQHKRITAWEARPGSGERRADGRSAGEITLDQIVYGSFRFNLERFVVGEVRGKEVLAMFKAMQGGAGSMSTTHADNAHGAIDRLATLAMEAGPHVSEAFAYRQIAEHIDLIVQINLEHGDSTDGSPPVRERYITEILHVERGENSQPATTHVYAPGPDGRGRPGVLSQPLARLAKFGFDAPSFTAGQAT